MKPAFQHLVAKQAERVTTCSWNSLHVLTSDRDGVNFPLSRPLFICTIDETADSQTPLLFANSTGRAVCNIFSLRCVKTAPDRKRFASVCRIRFAIWYLFMKADAINFIFDLVTTTTHDHSAQTSDIFISAPYTYLNFVLMWGLKYDPRPEGFIQWNKEKIELKKTDWFIFF